MGYFTKTAPGTTEPSRLPRLSTEAITTVLDSWEAQYLVDDDGDPGGYWDGHLFFFMRAGGDQTILTVRGRWGRELGAEHLDTVARLLNEWHSERLWPKGYVQDESGSLGIYADVSTPLGAGADQAQLDDFMGCGLGTALQLFAHLDEQFPEAAAAAAAATADALAESQADAD
jgi:hypothetical protein